MPQPRRARTRFVLPATWTRTAHTISALLLVVALRCSRWRPTPVLVTGPSRCRGTLRHSAGTTGAPARGRPPCFLLAQILRLVTVESGCRGISGRSGLMISMLPLEAAPRWSRLPPTPAQATASRECRESTRPSGLMTSTLPLVAALHCCRSRPTRPPETAPSGWHETTKTLVPTDGSVAMAQRRWSD